MGSSSDTQDGHGQTAKGKVKLEVDIEQMLIDESGIQSLTSMLNSDHVTPENQEEPVLNAEGHLSGEPKLEYMRVVEMRCADEDCRQYVPYGVALCPVCNKATKTMTTLKSKETEREKRLNVIKKLAEMSAQPHSDVIYLDDLKAIMYHDLMLKHRRDGIAVDVPVTDDDLDEKSAQETVEEELLSDESTSLLS